MALALAAGVPSPAQAAAPSNDRAGNARTATGIGYSDAVNVSQATSGQRDPTNCSNSASVWYKFTPDTTETVNVNTIGSNYSTFIGVYTGTPGAFTKVTCHSFDFNRWAAMDLRVEAGKTYYFMVGACCGNGRDGQDYSRQPLLLQFRMLTPLSIEQLITPDTGTVDQADGEAHVTVSHQCNSAADRSRVEATLRQRVGQTFVARGSSSKRTACGASSSDVTLGFPPRGDIAFGDGPAQVSVRLTACSRVTGTCTSRRLTKEVILALP